jgi:metallo-beta-lactamase class B
MRRQVHKRIAAVLTVLLLGAWSQISAQDKPAQDPMELAAQNPKLFLAVMEKKFGWEVPAEPMKVSSNLYFVGTKGLSVWLIKTSEGLILMNTAMPGSGPMIEASIRKLGFKPEDIKIMLAGHAHIDHVGGHS